MDTTGKAAEISMDRSSAIREAKALIEKLNLVLQGPSTPLLPQQATAQATLPDEVNDTTSEFSGYSMLTPSAASTLEHDENKSLPGQQVSAEGEVEVGVGFFAAELNGCGPKLHDDGDASSSHRHEDGGAAAEQSPMDHSDDLQTECDPTSQKPKLIGIVMTFDQGVDSEEGQKAVRLIGDQLSSSLGAQTGNVGILSIEGQGHLQVETYQYPEPYVHLYPVDNCGELVVTSHLPDDKCERQDRAQKSVRLPSTVMSPFPAPIFEPVGVPTALSENNTLLFHRTELAKARTLRTLIDSNGFPYSDESFNTSAKDAMENPGGIANESSPTLSQLIEIAKAKIHRKLTAPERVNVVDDSKLSDTAQKPTKKKSKSSTKTPKGKITSQLGGDIISIVNTAALLLTLIVLVLISSLSVLGPTVSVTV